MSKISAFWDASIVPTLVDYIRIPAKSPHFDKDWAKHGHIEAAVTLTSKLRAKVGNAGATIPKPRAITKLTVTRTHTSGGSR